MEVLMIALLDRSSLLVGWCFLGFHPWTWWWIPVGIFLNSRPRNCLNSLFLLAIFGFFVCHTLGWRALPEQVGMFRRIRLRGWWRVWCRTCSPTWVPRSKTQLPCPERSWILGWRHQGLGGFPTTQIWAPPGHPSVLRDDNRFDATMVALKCEQVWVQLLPERQNAWHASFLAHFTFL